MSFDSLDLSWRRYNPDSVFLQERAAVINMRSVSMEAEEGHGPYFLRKAECGFTEDTGAITVLGFSGREGVLRIPLQSLF